MKIHYGMLTTANAPSERKQRMDAALKHLPNCFIHTDNEPKPGPVLEPWLKLADLVSAKLDGEEMVCLLPDDCLLEEGFQEQHQAFVEHHTTYRVYDFYNNSPFDIPEGRTAWSTYDGVVGFGLTMRAKDMWDLVHRQRKRMNDRYRYAFDDLVNCWMLDNGLEAIKPAQTLIGHWDDVPSLAGTAGQRGVIRNDKPGRITVDDNVYGPILVYGEMHARWVVYSLPEQRPEKMLKYYELSKLLPIQREKLQSRTRQGPEKPPSVRA